MISQTEQQEGTTIRLSVKNRERLAKLGSKNDSYDDILDRILDNIELDKSKTQ